MREIDEESDLKEGDLSHFHEIGTVTGLRAFVSFWVGIIQPTAHPQSKTDEKVGWYDVDSLKDQALVENVKTIVDFSITELTKLKSGKTSELAKINLVYPYDLV